MFPINALFDSKAKSFFYLDRTNAVLPSAVGPENSYLSANINPSLNK